MHTTAAAAAAAAATVYGPLDFIWDYLVSWHQNS